MEIDVEAVYQAIQRLRYHSMDDVKLVCHPEFWAALIQTKDPYHPGSYLVNRCHFFSMKERYEKSRPTHEVMSIPVWLVTDTTCKIPYFEVMDGPIAFINRSPDTFKVERVDNGSTGLSNGIYTHFQGKDYEVVGIAIMEETGENFVIHHPVGNPKKLSLRSLNEFTSSVKVSGVLVPRFKLKKRRRTTMYLWSIKRSRITQTSSRMSNESV